MKFALFLLLIFFETNAQVIQNIEVEVVGKPSWQLIIPMDTIGVFLFIKSDIAKAKIVFFDKELKKKWEKDLYLDVENQPAAFSFDKEKFTFLFKETKGMYYQFFVFDLLTGKHTNKGFEIRENFNDQDYVYIGDKLLLAGSNEKGAAIYEYSFKTGKGRLISTRIEGKVQCLAFEYSAQNKNIKSLWSVKEISFTNEKRKKGEFFKDTYLTLADFDTCANELAIRRVIQQSANVPISAKLIELQNGKTILTGVYQSNLGDKGFFYNDLTLMSKENDLKIFSFKSLIDSTIQTKVFGRNINNFSFLPHFSPNNAKTIGIGGAFYRLEQGSKNHSFGGGQSNSGINFLGRNNHTQSNTNLNGYRFFFGIVLNISTDGMFVSSNSLELNLLSPQISQPLSFSRIGSIAYCNNAALIIRNFNIGSRPIVYKLTDEIPRDKEMIYLPSYNGVKFWYDNYFIGEGSKSKIEAISLKNIPNSKRKRNKSNLVYTQIRKTIYITKIASSY